MNPSDETLQILVVRLAADLRELWEERAAIRQYEGGQAKELAEAMALLDVIRMHPYSAFACWLRNQ